AALHAQVDAAQRVHGLAAHVIDLRDAFDSNDIGRVCGRIHDQNRRLPPPKLGPPPPKLPPGGPPNPPCPPNGFAALGVAVGVFAATMTCMPSFTRGLSITVR